MKQAKRLTRAQKIYVSRRHLNPDNWLCVSETNAEIVLQHRATGRIRKVSKNGD